MKGAKIFLFAFKESPCRIVLGTGRFQILRPYIIVTGANRVINRMRKGILLTYTRTGLVPLPEFTKVITLVDKIADVVREIMRMNVGGVYMMA